MYREVLLGHGSKGIRSGIVRITQSISRASLMESISSFNEISCAADATLLLTHNSFLSQGYS